MEQFTFDDLLYYVSDYYMTVHTTLKSTIDRLTKLYKTGGIDRDEFAQRVENIRVRYTSRTFMVNDAKICNLECKCEDISITHFSEGLDDNTVISVKIKVLDDRVFLKPADEDDRNG